MAKKIIRLRESDLHRIVKESVDNIVNGNLYGLQRMEGNELFDDITSNLQRLGDARVSKFYSDDYNITIIANRNISRRAIDDIMFGYGYSLYTAGADGSDIMYTYQKGFNN